jgi:hypothetical protein
MIMKKQYASVKESVIRRFCDVKRALTDEKAENYVDTGIKILIAVVIGALLLGGLYALFGETVLPELTRRVEEMFNYEG